MCSNNIKKCMKMINSIFRAEVTLASEKDETTDGYTESFNIFGEWSASSELYMLLLSTGLARQRFRSTAHSESCSLGSMGPEDALPDPNHPFQINTN